MIICASMVAIRRKEIFLVSHCQRPRLWIGTGTGQCAQLAWRSARHALLTRGTGDPSQLKRHESARRTLPTRAGRKHTRLVPPR